MHAPLLQTGEKGLPVLVDLDQDGVGDLARQGSVAFMGFEAVEDLCIGQVLAFMDVDLPNLVRRLVVEVFGSKSSGIDSHIARIALRNDMLLNQLHPRAPVSIHPRRALFCVWLALRAVRRY